MTFESSRERLREYFSTITYIDDIFDQCIVSSHEDVGDDVDIGDDPPLPFEEKGAQAELNDDLSMHVSDEEDPAAPEKDPSEVTLNKILSALNQEQYKDIRFNPVVYDKEFKDDNNLEALIEKIKKTPLTIIDWHLGNDERAFDVINKLFERTNQLKVIVVYTANYVEAKAALQENEKLKDSEQICEKSDACCYRCEKHSLIVIARKQSYDITGILSLVSDVFIDNCGIMPVMLLDYMASAQNRSDDLFSAFCPPFEDVYWLQLYFSELIDGGISEAITSFFRNKFREECKVNPSIIIEFRSYQKEKIKKLVNEKPKDLKKAFDLCLDKLGSTLSGDYQHICEAMKTNSEKSIYDCFEAAAKDDKTWEQSMEAFAPLLLSAKEYMTNQQTSSLFTKHLDKIVIPEELQEPLEGIKKEIQSNIAEDLNMSFSTFSKEILPVLIQIALSTPSVLDAGPELVKNLKYVSNENVCIKALLSKWKELEGTQKEIFLLNKFHFGDLLVRKTKQGTDYLLCITPPCDVFRPQKTSLIINFLQGKEIQRSDLNHIRKQNIHISVIPIIEKGKEQMKYIRWQLYGIKSFELKKQTDYEELCTYSRPLTMSEQYTRQIANAMIAHFSRAGVDEIFMKQNELLRAVFS